MAKASLPKPGVPYLLEMPSQLLAVVRSHGDPNVVGETVLPALYGAVYGLKFALKKQGIVFTVSPARGRWPNAHLAPKEEWDAIWGVPIPDDTTELVQKNPAVPVSIERWEYGMVAQILHVGSFATEGPTVQTLHTFIAEQGYTIAGVHEEEYLTRPGSKNQKTLIRYPVRKG